MDTVGPTLWVSKWVPTIKTHSPRYIFGLQAHIGLHLGGAEVLVHEMRSLQQFLKVVEADMQSDSQADRRPQRISAADPVPEAEHVLLSDAELGHRRFVGGQSREMKGNTGGRLKKKKRKKERKEERKKERKKGRKEEKMK